MALIHSRYFVVAVENFMKWQIGSLWISFWLRLCVCFIVQHVCMFLALLYLSLFRFALCCSITLFPIIFNVRNVTVAVKRSKCHAAKRNVQHIRLFVPVSKVPPICHPCLFPWKENIRKKAPCERYTTRYYGGIQTQHEQIFPAY